MRKIYFLIQLSFIALLFHNCISKKSNHNESFNKNNSNTNNYSISPLFKHQISKIDEIQFMIKYDSIVDKNKNLVKRFKIDYNHFKNLMLGNKEYPFVKFYFVQEAPDTNLILGMVLSKNDLYKISSEDKAYLLDKNIFIEESDLNKKADIYYDALAKNIWGNEDKYKTRYIVYKEQYIKDYFEERELEFENINELCFTMIYFGKLKNEIGEDYIKKLYQKKYNRISFTIHAIYGKTNDSRNQYNNVKFDDNGYDAGDLKP